MAIKHNPYNWEIRKGKKTVKEIKKKNDNLFKVKLELEANVTKEELADLVREAAKNVKID